MFLTGNPAASLVMKRDLQSITLEQASHGVTKTQATPLMFDKLAMLCRYLTYRVWSVYLTTRLLGRLSPLSG